jgi:hypothetical protein
MGKSFGSPYFTRFGPFWPSSKVFRTIMFGLLLIKGGGLSEKWERFQGLHSSQGDLTLSSPELQVFKTTRTLVVLNQYSQITAVVSFRKMGEISGPPPFTSIRSLFAQSLSFLDWIIGLGSLSNLGKGKWKNLVGFNNSSDWRSEMEKTF